MKNPSLYNQASLSYINIFIFIYTNIYYHIMQVFLDEVYLNETALSLSDPSMYSFYQLLRVLRMYILPIVCGIGFVLQLWVILVCCYPRGPMRKCSLQPYLVSLAISDVVFLSMVMLDWVKTTDANLDYYSR